MIFRFWLCISSVSCIALSLLIVFLPCLFVYSSLFAISPRVAVYLPQMCSAALVDYYRGDCGSNFLYYFSTTATTSEILNILCVWILILD